MWHLPTFKTKKLRYEKVRKFGPQYPFDERVASEGFVVCLSPASFFFLCLSKIILLCLSTNVFILSVARLFYYVYRLKILECSCQDEFIMSFARRFYYLYRGTILLCLSTD